MTQYVFTIDYDENGKPITGLLTVLPTWEDIRLERDRLLSESDWVALADCALSDSEKQNWFQYRQSLRDITTSYPTPQDVVWPEKP